ncbi:hypothetical protein G6M89_22020 [Natronolimnobius sp. AArcel1]|uniref:hypothetical protein n=1 Tax=Natronolimnobius sp. AArcel1 TaxID=1679093 RepID=UPI0013ED95DB|nr:hypothetical protein [Natronolimnobius sp. AArcel1]NGM71622.1 hypothetical protein [Natronolimnobius sp. AArcel1]
MILEVQQTRGHHVVLAVDEELCDTVVSACELRGEWFDAHGDEEVGNRLDAIATIWMVGRRHGCVHTRVAWLALAADACEWYATSLQRTREVELAHRTTDACWQLRNSINEFRLMNDTGRTIREIW